MNPLYYEYNLFRHEIKNAVDVCKIPLAERLPYIEHCYQLSVRCWERIEQIALERPFDSLASEILFFKSIKPSFTAEIVYYALLFHAELFKPPAGDKLLPFFEREKKRYAGFLEKHEQFSRYYRSGYTQKDDIYFRQVQDPKAIITNDLTSMPPVTLASTHDPLVANLLSLEKYDHYVTVQLEGYRNL